MTTSSIKLMGTPSLLERSTDITEITDETKALAETLVATMRAENGVGIAAPQIGINQRMIVIGFNENPRYPSQTPIPIQVLINPTFEPIGTEMTPGWEGCLSVPGLRGLVERHEHIRYQAVDLDGNAIDRTVSGFHARVIQHEVDHLDGVLYPHRIKDLRYFGYETALTNM